MALLQSLNVGTPRPTKHSDIRRTAIDKRPVEHAVDVSVPAAKGVGGSGIAGDAVCDKRHHGGPDQAIYAYAREDLDDWATDLGRDLPSGSFGENMTTEGMDVSGARIGERWRVGEQVVLEVSTPRIPCRTFAGFVGEPRWVRRFTERATPGTYLRVIEPGQIRSGDSISVIYRPDHDVTVELTFRAMTTAPELLPLLLAADALPAEAKAMAAKRAVFALDE
jgi:MOSC domain-containing protein YiiM